MIVLIPAYKPDEKFLKFLDELNANTDFKIISVDDGGGPKYDEIFKKAEEKGVTLIRYEKNRGKGGALKEGFKYIMENEPMESVITADCDGQHTVADILSVAEKLKDKKNTLVLGCREIKKMPLRSKAGNTLTKFFFFLLSGKMLTETQTGVRGITPDLFAAFSEIKGDRFEYEINMLFYAVDNDVLIDEAPISTTYIDDNKSTHFNALRDGYKIYSLMFGKKIAEIVSFFLSAFLAYFLLNFYPPEMVGLSQIILVVLSASALRVVIMSIIKMIQNGGKIIKPDIFEVLFGIVIFGIFIALFHLFFTVLAFTAAQTVTVVYAIMWIVRLVLRGVKMAIRKRINQKSAYKK